MFKTMGVKDKQENSNAFSSLNRESQLRVKGKKYLTSFKRLYDLIKFIEILINYKKRIIQEDDYIVAREVFGQKEHVIDVGANMGQSLLSFINLYPKASIKSFEPNKGCFIWLKMIRRLFFLKRIEIYNLALGKVSGTTPLYIPIEGQVGQTQLGFVDDAISVNQYDIDSAECQIVEQKTLDELDLKCDLLKIDVQGAEINVLLGARKLIERELPVIICEINDNEREIETFLFSFGYKKNKNKNKTSENEIYYHPDLFHFK